MNQKKTDLAIYMRGFFDGGVERIISNLIQEFIGRGLKVDLVLNQVSPSSMLKRLPSDVKIIDLKANKFSQFIPRLISYLKREKPKTLLSAVHPAPEIAIIAKYLAMVSTRVVVSENTNLSLDIEIGNPLGNQIKSNLIPLAIRFLYPLADAIISCSHGVAKDLSKKAKLPLESIEVIYYPVITPQLLTQSQELIDHPWFTEGKIPVILGVGRLDIQKDFANLIRAFSQVIKVQPAKLVILGSGREEQKLNSLIHELGLENDVALLGFVDNPYPYIAKSAVFVLSSLWEGLPTVLIESMALGTPVVSTNCPSGPIEILDNGKYGELLPVGDSKALAEAILKVLSGEIKSVDSDWLEQFTLKKVIEQYYECLACGN